MKCRKVSKRIKLFRITGETARDRARDVWCRQIVKTFGHQLKELSYSPEMMRASKRARVCDLEGSFYWNGGEGRGAKNRVRETSQNLLQGMKRNIKLQEKFKW